MRLRHHFEVGKLSLAKARLASVSALARFRRSANAKPTTEKRRSTVAEVAGTPKYCRAMRARLGESLTLWFAHHLIPSLRANQTSDISHTWDVTRSRRHTGARNIHVYIWLGAPLIPISSEYQRTCMHGAAGKDLSRGSRAAAIFLALKPPPPW